MDVKIRKQRSKRNTVARALMEGYSEDYQQYRFALLSAEIAIQAISDWENSNAR